MLFYSVEKNNQDQFTFVVFDVIVFGCNFKTAAAGFL